MVHFHRNRIKDSSRKPEMIWYDRDADWRVVVTSLGNQQNRFHVILGTELYKSRHNSNILPNTTVQKESVVGYENAISKATELIQEAEQLVAEHKGDS